MSEKDEVASVAASHLSSQARSAKEDMMKEGLTPDHLESLYTDLPDDATALKAIVGTMRIEIAKKDQLLAKLKEEVDEVKASHSVVLQRSAEWQDELETLRLRVPHLEQELQAEKQAREAESDRVKDLRIRAEESRRAIMRLQGEQSDARTKAKVDNRRSWIPAATNPPPVRDENEEAELRKSKRASLAFGPNALNLTSRPGSSQGFGHRRTASGGRSVSGASKGDGEDVEEPLSPTFANGLRGLRLSGTAGTNGTSNSLLLPVTTTADDSGSAPNSRRSSFRSDSGKSPRIGPNDLPAQETTDMASSLGARLSVPGAGLGAPRTSLLSSPALSQGAASSAGIGSPIIEDNEEEEAGPSLSAAVASKALPNLPTRESSMYDRELRAKEVEIERLSREMAEMRLSMDEALEARKASEACLKALRDFIANHDAEADANAQMGDDADRIVQRASFGTGLLKGVKLPPLPTDNIDDAEEAAHVKASSSPQKTATAGWSMKLPTLMRKATSSSIGGASASNGPTPSDEARSGMPGTTPSSEVDASGSVHSSPRGAASGGSAPQKSLASGFAGFSNLLGRTGTTPNEPSAAPSSSQSQAPAADSIASPQPMADEGAGSGFKGFGWFKRSSVLAGTSPVAQAEANVTVEEKVMSPPFRSLDHDQLSISRQSVISPLSETLAKQLANGFEAHPPPMRSSSSSGSALALAARLGDEDNAKKVAENIQRSEPERSHRAQMAAEKTEQVEHLTDVVPSFD
ncbi:hypothetical protein PANT_7d00270 [Moesziomyces antarcticus T-34]|uniref:Uncharacterized protein n=1 Tax=Pseudozyma antarctica (strain T-34) TaxID=1151754 RepID=M9MBP7_PSEA3|nr:hypothetical protein PANT_7d00270 [Moesziomyces antarcticus T-34]